jgi:hypothetical protein
MSRAGGCCGRSSSVAARRTTTSPTRRRWTRRGRRSQTPGTSSRPWPPGSRVGATESAGPFWPCTGPRDGRHGWRMPGGRRPSRRWPSAETNAGLYLDASALVQLYVAEPGSDAVRSAMRTARGWYMCRVRFAETPRALALAAGESAVRGLAQEWPRDCRGRPGARRARHLARVRRRVRSLDVLHLASALPPPRLTCASRAGIGGGRTRPAITVCGCVPTPGPRMRDFGLAPRSAAEPSGARGPISV